MINLRIISVNKRTSSEVDTTHYTYENDERKYKRTKGAEWEEIEFITELEEKPAIQIANIAGNVVILSPVKLIINDPRLFGTYKVGDIIEFTPNRVKEEKGMP